MLYTAAILILLAAFLGFYLLSFVLQNKETPKAIAFTHGPLAATGLVILIIYALQYTPAPLASITLLILAALGGLLLITLDLMGKTVPKWLAIGHGLIALTGFICLIVFMTSQ